MKVNLKFWRKRKLEAPLPSTPQRVEGDWSLRPSAATYMDRAQETHKVLARIDKSTASIVGIAGVRGSGKSSLALKVLEENSKKGAFTLLIHSPTGYEPHEFLLSIFQRICERVIFLLDVRFGEDGSLKEKGLQELRRLRRYSKLSLLAGLIITLASFGLSFYQYDAKASAANAFFENKLQEARATENKTKAIIDRIDTGELLEITPEQAAHYRSELREAQETRTMLEERKADFEGSRLFPTFSSYISLGLAALLFYGSLIIGSIYYRRFRRRGRLVQSYPSETGLRRLAIDMLEHLSYQRTLSTNAETGLGLGKASSKFSRGKTLQARPVSLPGLTAECSRFLELTASVFGGRAVVCLDELDKIKEPEELEKLLRGVKGILTSHRVHFLLTVSEDALARFSTRQRASRDILESTFEEIVALDRVNLDLAKHIVLTVSDYESTHPSPQIASSPLFWIFGSGIPREIKRGALLCRDAGLDPIRTSALEIWRVLYVELVDSISSWAALVSGEDSYSYHFLRTLEKLRSVIPSETFQVQQAPDWVADLLKISVSWRGLISAVDAEEESSEGVSGTELKVRPSTIAHPFRRAMLEIVLAGSSCLWTMESGGVSASLPNQAEEELLSLFNYFSSNLEFAERKATMYIRLLESTGFIGPSWKAASVNSKERRQSGRKGKTQERHLAITEPQQV